MRDQPEKLTFAFALRTFPEDASLRAIASDACEEAGDMDTAGILRAGRVPLTDLDREAVEALVACTFLPGSYNKRFAHNMNQLVTCDGRTWLSPKQYACLWALVRRYRRQIRLVVIVEEAERVHQARKAQVT